MILFGYIPGIRGCEKRNPTDRERNAETVLSTSLTLKTGYARGRLVMKNQQLQLYKPMTAETIPNENVQAVLDDLSERTGSETKCMYHDGDFMHVKIDLNRLVSDTSAGLIESLITRHNWELDELHSRRDAVEMSGQAYDVR